jgi:3D (Asp-Asp-Asp) domain-containing protein
MKSFFGGSAVVAVALLGSTLVFSARPSVAETLLSQFQQQKQETAQTPTQQPKAVMESPGSQAATDTNSSSATTLGGVNSEVTDPANSPTNAHSAEAPATRPSTYVATAYSLGGRTASGKRVVRGLIAADPSVLPLGTRVRVEAGPYSGEYLVADTGGAVRGKRIDIWTPNSREAMRFGRRAVKLIVLSYGPKHLRNKRKALK